MPAALQAIAWTAQLISNAAVAAAEYAGADEATAVALANAAVTLSAAVAVGVAANALAPKTPTPEAMHETVRQTIPPRRIGCGRTRTGGAMLCDTAIGNVLYIILAHADCAMSMPVAYYLHQDQVQVVGNVVQSLPNGAYDSADQRVKVYTNTQGVSGVNAFPALNGEQAGLCPANFYATGIAASYLRCESPKLQYFSHDFPYGPLVQLNVVADWNVFYDWRNPACHIGDPTTWVHSANPVVVLVNVLWRYCGYDWTSELSPTLASHTTAANICDQPVPIRNVFTKISVDGHRGDGSVHVADDSGLSSGMQVFIGGQAFTATSAPAADGQGGYTFSLSGTLIADAGAGTIVRWLSNPDAPVTKPRYEAHGLWNVSENESETVGRLLKAMAGFMCRRVTDGAVIIRAGAYAAPTVTIGADEVIDYTWQPYVLDGAACNELACAFVSAAHGYVQVDTDPWQDADDIAARGQVFSQPFVPELVQSNSQVRRLAKIEMSKRLVNQETLRLKASALRLLQDADGNPMQFFTLQAGGESVTELADIVFEIVDTIEIADNGLHIIVPVKAVDPTAYSWDWQSEEGNGPSDGAAPVSTVLTAPAITSVTAFFDQATDGSTGVRLSIAATGPTRSDLTWFYRWRKTGDTSWTQGTDSSVTGGSVTLTTAFVVVAPSVDVQVAYQTGAGTLSDWGPAVPDTVSTSTDGVAPSAITSPAATAATTAGQINVAWRNSTSANFDHAVIQRSTSSSMTGPVTVATVTGAAGANETYPDTGLTTGTTYYYTITAYNAAGTSSVGPPVVVHATAP